MTSVLNTLLATAFASIVIMVVYLKLSQKQSAEERAMQDRLSSLQHLTNEEEGVDSQSFMEGTGLGTDDAKTVEQVTVPECVREPDAMGACPTGFVLEEEDDTSGTNRCCVLPTETTNTTLSLVKDITVELAVGEAAEFVMGKVFGRLKAKLAKTALAKSGGKGALKAAKLSLQAGKMSAKLGKGALKAMASIRPSPTFVLEMASMALDIADVEGYNNFTENAIIQQAIAQSHKELEERALLQGVELPLLFPLEDRSRWSTRSTPYRRSRTPSWANASTD